MFSITESKVSLCFTDISHVTMRTFKFIDNVRGEEGGERLLMSEQGVDGFRVSEDESEGSFRVAMFEGLVEFFPNVQA